MKLICCNFKMNLLQEDINNYLNKVKNISKDNIIFFPSIPYINNFKNNNCIVGSQDISFMEQGSITGDTSILQLKELGITWTILGHSERRNYYNEDKYVNKKLNISLKNNINVILCIGEKEKQNLDLTLKDLKQEIDEAIKNNLDLIKNNLVIAYEPCWAIGKNQIPSNKYIEEIIIFIKEYLINTYSIDAKVLYGGSVNLNNINNLETIKNIDGYLIGSASLNPDNFLELLAKIN